MVGQALRTIVGLKKTYNHAATNEQSFGEVFEWSQLLTSLLIGFVAGILGMLAMTGKPDFKWSNEIVMGLMAVGYSGADFIEGFVRKNLPTQASGGSSAPGAGGNNNNAQNAAGNNNAGANNAGNNQIPQPSVTGLKVGTTADAALTDENIVG